MTGNEVSLVDIGYFPAGTKVVAADDDSPLVPDRVYIVDRTNEKGQVFVTQYHWPLDASEIRRV